MKLIYEATGLEPKVNEEITSFRGETYILTGWREPHKPGSSGHIYVRYPDEPGGVMSAEYYPSVFDMKFVP